MINENVAFARSILSKNNITNDSPEYKDYLRIREICGTSNGYVGILTRLRFIDKVTDMDEIESIFQLLKGSNIDISKLNNMTYDNILDMFYTELTANKNKEDYELVLKDDSYSYFRVYTYKGILEIGSPAWCLKTKSKWDEYQINYPIQYVVISNEYVNKIISPNNSYLSEYKNTQKKWIRYGISVKDNGDTFNLESYNDNNDREKISVESHTFFQVYNTIINLVSNIKKPHYLNYTGCKFVSETKVATLLEIKNMNDLISTFRNSTADFSPLKKNDTKYYISFSKGYDRVPYIIGIGYLDIFFFTPVTCKSRDFRYINLSNRNIINEIIKFATAEKSYLYEGLRINENIQTIDCTKTKSFVTKIDNYLIFDMISKYLVVNTKFKKDDSGEPCYELPLITIDGAKYDMENPVYFYIDKRPSIKPSINYPNKDIYKDISDKLLKHLTENNKIELPVKVTNNTEPKEKNPIGVGDKEEDRFIDKFKKWIKRKN